MSDPDSRSVRGNYPLRLEPDEVKDLHDLAHRRGFDTTLAFLRHLIAQAQEEDAAERTDRTMAPIVSQQLKTIIFPMRDGLHSLNAKVGHEVLRTQYILCQFILYLLTDHIEDPLQKEAAEKMVWQWYEDGWSTATKRMKQKNEIGSGG